MSQKHYNVAQLLTPEELKAGYLQNIKKPVWVEIVNDNKCEPVVNLLYLVDFGGVVYKEKASQLGIPTANWADNMAIFCSKEDLMKYKAIRDADKSVSIDPYTYMQKFTVDCYNTRPFGFRCWTQEPTTEQRKNQSWTVSLDFSPAAKGLLKFYYGQNPVELDDPCEGCRRKPYKQQIFHCDRCDAINCRPGYVLIEFTDSENVDCSFFMDKNEAVADMAERYYDTLFDLRIVEIEHNGNDSLYLHDDCASVLFTDKNGKRTDLYWNLVKPVCHIDGEGECQCGIFPCKRETEIVSVVYQHNDDIECHLFASIKDSLRFMRQNFFDKLLCFGIEPDKYSEKQVFIDDKEAYIQIDQYDGTVLNFSWAIAPVTNFTRQEDLD